MKLTALLRDRLQGKKIYTIIKCVKVYLALHISCLMNSESNIFNATINIIINSKQYKSSNDNWLLKFFFKLMIDCVFSIFDFFTIDCCYFHCFLFVSNLWFVTKFTDRDRFFFDLFLPSNFDTICMTETFSKSTGVCIKNIQHIFILVWIFWFSCSIWQNVCL